MGTRGAARRGRANGAAPAAQAQRAREPPAEQVELRCPHRQRVAYTPRPQPTRQQPRCLPRRDVRCNVELRLAVPQQPTRPRPHLARGCNGVHRGCKGVQGVQWDARGCKRVQGVTRPPAPARVAAPTPPAVSRATPTRASRARGAAAPPPTPTAGQRAAPSREARATRRAARAATPPMRTTPATRRPRARAARTSRPGLAPPAPTAGPPPPCCWVKERELEEREGSSS